ncbi:unnamed protein product, partial [Ectocarpus fasciculatus]
PEDGRAGQAEGEDQGTGCGWRGRAAVHLEPQKKEIHHPVQEGLGQVGRDIPALHVPPMRTERGRPSAGTSC